MLIFQPAVNICAMSERRFSDKRLASSTVTTFPAKVDTAESFLAGVFVGGGFFLLRRRIMRNVVPERHPLPLQPTVEAATNKSEALP